MNGEQIPRDGLNWMQWAMREHERLANECQVLWDALDGLQSKEDFESTKKAYDHACDAMDILEALPECAFLNHPIRLSKPNSTGDAAYCWRSECLKWAKVPPLPGN